MNPESATEAPFLIAAQVSLRPRYPNRIVVYDIAIATPASKPASKLGPTGERLDAADVARTASSAHTRSKPESGEGNFGTGEVGKGDVTRQ